MSSLYQIVSAAFCVIVVVSNIISAKMVTLTFFFGDSFNVPAGLITYPLTFLLSDLVTEVFGAKKAKLMVYIAFTMSLLSYAIIQAALFLPPHSGYNDAFGEILGTSTLRIFSSLTAYLVSQVVDIQVYAWIKSLTGVRLLWLRNNASTCISQLVDTLLIDLIFLYWGLGMAMGDVIPIILFSFAYKACFSVANTPLFYLCLFLVKKWEAINHSKASSICSTEESVIRSAG